MDLYYKEAIAWPFFGLIIYSSNVGLKGIIKQLFGYLNDSDSAYI